MLDSKKTKEELKNDKLVEEKKEKELKSFYECSSVSEFIKYCAVGDGGVFRYMTTEDGQRTRTFEFEVLPLIGLTDETKMVLETMPRKSEKYSYDFFHGAIGPRRIFLLAKAIGEQGEGEHIVGFAQIQMGTMYDYNVECVSVETEFQKHEISSRLVLIIASTVSKIPRKIRSVWTDSVNPVTNQDEMKAYQSNGFQPKQNAALPIHFQKLFKPPQVEETFSLDWLDNKKPSGCNKDHCPLK